jgi:uncharacterized membrane protein
LKTTRLEAFSDGVIAVIITIMVLELKVPHDDSFRELESLIPVLLSYVLSFLYVGIYWNNHHHMMHTTEAVSGSILWANLHLLFWLSLFPFATSWVGEYPNALAPTALYGAILLMAALAYTLLQHAIIIHQGANSVLRKAIGRDWKGKFSIVLYIGGILLAFHSARAAQCVYYLVALVWFIPDKRIERTIAHGPAR